MDITSSPTWTSVNHRLTSDPRGSSSKTCRIRGLFQYQCHINEVYEGQIVPLCRPFVRLFRL
jgi:hypothetical protein